jgi:hypothetical protein
VSRSSLGLGRPSSSSIGQGHISLGGTNLVGEALAEEAMDHGAFLEAATAGGTSAGELGVERDECEGD